MRLLVLFGLFIAQAVPVFAQPIGAGQASLRFFGNGINDIDRVKIPLVNPVPNGASLPVNVGNNFTIEFWMRAFASENTGIVYDQNNGDGWITGNTIFDRDIFGSPDNGDFGISIGRPSPSSPIRVVAFGCAAGSTGRTIIGTTNVADGNWHHVAVTKSGSTIRIFVDGNPEAAATNAPAGSVAYNPARSLTTRTPNPPAFPTNTWDNEPYIVLGAEKHDYDQYANNSPAQYLSYSGFLDELRISNTVRYTSAFTPPTAPFAPDANTVGLYHFDEGIGTTLTNSISTLSNGAISVGGLPAGPVWSSESPFGANGAAATVVRSVSNTTTTADFNDVGQVTGVRIDFTGASGSGTVRVQRFTNAPLNPSGILGNVSQYQWIITSLGTFSFTSATLRFRISEIPNSGIANAATVLVYRRPTPDHGNFVSLSMLLPQGGDLRATTTAFSEFSLGSSDNPLPVELSDFQAQAVHSGVELFWRTQSEHNNAGFEIWRAQDGQAAQMIASYRYDTRLVGKGTTTTATTYTFLDPSVESGKIYTYRLRSTDFDGTVHDYAQTVTVEVRDKPLAQTIGYALMQNYPNPFNPTTLIRFTMKEAGLATLTINDVLGREVWSVRLFASAGENLYRFNGANLGSGVYFYTLRANGFVQTRKMMLAK
ncbi:MAG: LamG-like jellyroll fold domain-containing protein [Chloroherpetonaceae bacterium]|nr:LamG-like jellyroll fold domain-containing protein [Chloroherpetonaceae bacterium]